jgi:hypothetical protein
MVNIKLDPFPNSDVTDIFPPCNSTNFFVIDKQRPVPEIELTMGEFTRLNGLKISSTSNSEIPIPLSSI